MPVSKIILTNYSVAGIKSIDKKVSLSFYRKTIFNDLEVKGYNVKGIYGINGSGKSGIVTSADIFRNILINSKYLNNPLVQRDLKALVNKSTNELIIEAEFVTHYGMRLRLYLYSVKIGIGQAGQYVIKEESLSCRPASSRIKDMKNIFKVVNGNIVSVYADVPDEVLEEIKNKSMNLLATASLPSIFANMGDVCVKDADFSKPLALDLLALIRLGINIHVSMDDSDDHTYYFLYRDFYGKAESDYDNLVRLIQCSAEKNQELLKPISPSDNNIPIDRYPLFEKRVLEIERFIKIFKSDLRGIEIEKKQNRDCYVCNLIMQYDDYQIYSEFESTGIKKLMSLYVYIREMLMGGIVFIDEFDSNLHDVYLCALLDYVMTYGKGQLCFTTHNVGPMDVLRRNKKSIDFLSEDRQIYSWKTNGNYSPSKLYREGMIDGSPFNVEAIDFIGVFGDAEVDDI